MYENNGYAYNSLYPRHFFMGEKFFQGGEGLPLVTVLVTS